MLILEPHKLAEALQEHLKTQIVIRYALQSQGQLKYNAELVVLSGESSEACLIRVAIEAYFHNKVYIQSDFRMSHLPDEPNALVEICDGWRHRRFDDWNHSTPFMGAYEIYRDGFRHTSVKLDADDARWRFLTGVVLGELRRINSLYSEELNFGRATELMLKRFSAFAAQSEEAWANKTLTAC